jgi:hypothetical protein
MDVMLVAVKKDVINDYTNVIKEAGLNPVVIDVDSFALENMMEINYPVAPGENIAMVNIGASITSISVILGGLTITGPSPWAATSSPKRSAADEHKLQGGRDMKVGKKALAADASLSARWRRYPRTWPSRSRGPVTSSSAAPRVRT